VNETKAKDCASDRTHPVGISPIRLPPRRCIRSLGERLEAGIRGLGRMSTAIEKRNGLAEEPSTIALTLNPSAGGTKEGKWRHVSQLYMYVPRILP
jgi:hypothetical protein